MRNKVGPPTEGAKYSLSANLFQGCGSGMIIPDPDFFLSIPDPGSRIPDLTTETKRGGRKKLFLTFLWPNI
jgi:hypothetical protein